MGCNYSGTERVRMETVVVDEALNEQSDFLCGSCEEFFDVSCEPCAEIRNQNTEAKKYCQTCGNNLCLQCEVNHNFYNKNHTLVDVPGKDCVGSVDMLTTIEEDKCDIHEDRDREIFCVDHDELVCMLCQYQDHKDCEVKHFNDISQEGAEIQPEEPLHELNMLDKQVDWHLQQLSKEKEKHLKAVETYRKYLFSRINCLERNAKKEIDKRIKTMVTHALTKKQLCSTLMEYVNKHKNALMTRSRRSKIDWFKCAEEFKRGVERLSNDCEKLKQTTIVFNLEKRIESSLGGFNTLGMLDNMYKASLKDCIYVAGPGSPEICNIIAVIVRVDETLLLADAGKRNLKLIEPLTGSTIDEYDLQADLKGMTYVDPDTVIVAAGNEKIQVFSLGNNIVFDRCITLPNNCSLIAKSDGELIAAHHDTLHMYDMSGEQIREINMTPSGQKMFSMITGIVVLEERNRVYIADASKGIICLDRSGTEMFRCSNEEMKIDGAHGICTDGKEILFVGGLNNVLQITHDGRVLGLLLSEEDQIETLQWMCYDCKVKTLYIGGQTGCIKAYKLT